MPSWCIWNLACWIIIILMYQELDSTCLDVFLDDYMETGLRRCSSSMSSCSRCRNPLRLRNKFQVYCFFYCSTLSNVQNNKIMLYSNILRLWEYSLFGSWLYPYLLNCVLYFNTLVRSCCLLIRYWAILTLGLKSSLSSWLLWKIKEITIGWTRRARDWGGIGNKGVVSRWYSEMLKHRGVLLLCEPELLSWLLWP